MGSPLEQLRAELTKQRQHWVVLTGAGASAASGIPTYRDRSGKWLGSQPIQHREFISEFRHRQRYWARSVLGWPGVRDAQPNELHRTLASWEQQRGLSLLITQNVDRLHQRAGSQSVIDLHGRLDRVRCLDCGAGYDRQEIQQQLLDKNPDHPCAAGTVRPDGDADLPPDAIDRFEIVDCAACGGMLMPDVVFFGGSVPKTRVRDCEQAIEAAAGLIVIGSSLQVFSGFRFARLAHELGKPLVIINEGMTRADPLADIKLEHDALRNFTHLLATMINPQPQRLTED